MLIAWHRNWQALYFIPYVIDSVGRCINAALDATHSLGVIGFAPNICQSIIHWPIMRHLPREFALLPFLLEIRAWTMMHRRVGARAHAAQNAAR